MLGLEESQWNNLPSTIESEMKSYYLTVRINIVWGRKQFI
jgi:hypothetical protein